MLIIQHNPLGEDGKKNMSSIAFSTHKPYMKKENTIRGLWSRLQKQRDLRELRAYVLEFKNKSKLWYLQRANEFAEDK